MGEFMTGKPITRLNDETSKWQNLQTLLKKSNKLNEGKLKQDNTLKNCLKIIKKNGLKKVILFEKEKYPECIINKLWKVK